MATGGRGFNQLPVLAAGPSCYACAPATNGGALVPSRLIRSSIGDNSRTRLSIKNRSFSSFLISTIIEG